MKSPHWMHPPEQGLLDIQLSFPGTQQEINTPVLNAIVKRDKRVEHYDSDKVVNSIDQAARSIGLEDEALARSLASSVTLYLIQQTRMKGLNVSHVAEAIERVLVEMGHERIALAYAQYRGKHAQVTRESEDGAAPLREWHWTRSASTVEVDAVSCIADECARCVVPNSNREAIQVEVLDKLKRLAMHHPSQALIVEITRQVIRENDSLDIEPDLVHLSLGVVTTEEALSESSSPFAADRVIAGQTKEAYALHALFNEQAAQAHQQGAVHIHGLTQVDRVYSLCLSPDIVKSMGTLSHERHVSVEPARKIEALIDDVITSTHFLQGYCANAVEWEAINYSLAPYLVEFDAAALREVSEQLVQGLEEDSQGFIRLGINWNPPPDLQGVEAIGPNGAYTGKPYEEYGHTAQDFALVLMQVLLEHGATQIVPVITMPTAGLDDESAIEYLRLIAVAALELPSVEVCGDATPLMLPFQESTLQAKEMVAQCVTLNMPKVVYALKDGGNFWTELDRVFDVAVGGVAEKHCFLNTLIARKQNGPYGLFSLRHQHTKVIDFDSAAYGLNCCGLRECAALLQENMPEQSDTTKSDWVDAILAHLEQRCVAWTQEYGIVLRLFSVYDVAVAERLTQLDLRLEPAMAKGVVEGDSTGCYSMGLSHALDLGDVHTLGYAVHGGAVRIDRPDMEDISTEKLAAVLVSLFQEKPEIGLLFTR